MYLQGPTRLRLLPFAEALTGTLKNLVGLTRDEVDGVLDALPHAVKDRPITLGLRKLCEDRATYGVSEGPDPAAIRETVFLASAKAHRGLGLRETFNRDAVLAEAAAQLGIAASTVETRLFADLKGAEVLLDFEPIGAEELLQRYDLALAQALLLRARRIVLRVEGEAPRTYRALFRAARFHGLLHVVEGDEARGYTITLDGPLSLFDAGSRYGMRLAIFLPHVLALRAFHLRAELLWGKSRQEASFVITAQDGLLGRPFDAALSPELVALCEAFERLGSPWTVAPNDRVVALPGEPVIVPDLVFVHRDSGSEVHFEHFGFWSRDAVFRRVEAIRKGLPIRLLLAVGKHLRVSEEVLGEDDAGEVYVYKTALSPRAVRDRLDALVRTPLRRV